LLPSSIETVHHIFTKSKGLVQGGYKGEIHITKFDDYKPKQPIVASHGFQSRVTSLTTKEDIIAAGSIDGEFGIWNYDGVNLYRTNFFRHIHSISIRPDKLILALDNSIHELKYQPHELNSLKVELLRKIDVKSDWASFDLEGVSIIYGKNPSDEESGRSWRPVFPESAGNLNLYHLSSVKDFETDRYEITIQEVLTQNVVRKELCSRRIRGISRLWCDCERLYLISQDSICMVDFAEHIRTSNKNTVSKTVECFSLGEPFEW
jgi:hypothetical protein